MGDIPNNPYDMAELIRELAPRIEVDTAMLASMVAVVCSLDDDVLAFRPGGDRPGGEQWTWHRRWGDAGPRGAREDSGRISTRKDLATVLGDLIGLGSESSWGSSRESTTTWSSCMARCQS